MQGASGSEKVAKVRIVVAVNTCSVRDSVYCHTSNNPLVSPTLQGPVRHFLQPLSSNESNCHVLISFPVAIHFRSRSNPPTRGRLPGSRSDPHKSTHAKTRSSADRIELDPIAIRSRLKRQCGQAFSSKIPKLLPYYHNILVVKLKLLNHNTVLQTMMTCYNHEQVIGCRSVSLLNNGVLTRVFGIHGTCQDSSENCPVFITTVDHWSFLAQSTDTADGRPVCSCYVMAG